MSLFQEYENLKAANQLLTPGSIWRDNMGEVKIREATQAFVFFVNMPDEEGCGYMDTYPKTTFIRHFHRIR